MPQMESAANLRRQYGDIELVISCGDMPSVYLEFIVSVLNVPLFYVRGNHDEMYSQSPPGGEDLHNRVIKYGGLTFAGLEGSIRYNRGDIQYSDLDMYLMVLGYSTRLFTRKLLRKRPIDIFVTHSPAYKLHDRDDFPHRGFKSFRTFMKWYKPRFMIHGHVHTYDRRDTIRSVFEETCVINVNPVTVLEITPDEGECL